MPGIYRCGAFRAPGCTFRTSTGNRTPIRWVRTSYIIRYVMDAGPDFVRACCLGNPVAYPSFASIRGLLPSLRLPNVAWIRGASRIRTVCLVGCSHLPCHPAQAPSFRGAGI